MILIPEYESKDKIITREMSNSIRGVLHSFFTCVRQVKFSMPCQVDVSQ